jgi:hypothetical protein
LVVENISPHSVVAGGQRLPLFLVRQHPGNYSVRSRKRIAIRRTKSGGRKQQKESTEDVLSSHNQSWTTNLPRYSRQASLKNSPNRGLSTSFCTSRGLK